jgi:uncharacterized membrane protein
VPGAQSGKEWNFSGYVPGRWCSIAPMETTYPKKPGLAVLLVILFSCAIRFFGLGHKQLETDEILQVIHSMPDSAKGILEGVAQDRGSAPLDYFVQHYAMKAAGQVNEIAARLHAAFFGSISIVLIYFIGIKLFRSRQTALLSSALYGVYPLHHYYSQEGRPYVLFVFLALLLFLLHQKLREQFSWKIAITMILLAIASFYAHPYTVILLAVLVTIELLHSWRSHRQLTFQKSLVATIGAGALGALAFLPWTVFSFHNARGDGNAWLAWRLAPDTIKAFGNGSYIFAMLLLPLAVFGAIRLKKDRSDALIDLCCWMLVPFPVVFTILYWRSYFFNARQLLFMTPAIIFCAAYGLNYLLSAYRKSGILLAILYFCTCITIIGLHFEDKRIDFKGAAAYLKQNVGQDDRIFAPKIGGLLSFYFPETLQHDRNYIEQAAPGGSRIFAIETRYADGNDRQVLDALQKRSSLRLEFRGIKISVFNQQPR